MHNATFLGPADFTPVTRVLFFTGVPLPVSIPIIADSVVEGDETFTVRLVASMALPPGHVISPAVATITIINGE